MPKHTPHPSQPCNPIAKLPPDSPVEYLGEDFTVKVTHTKYFRRDEFYKGVDDTSQTILARTLPSVDLKALSDVLNK